MVVVAVAEVGGRVVMVSEGHDMIGIYAFKIRVHSS